MPKISTQHKDVFNRTAKLLSTDKISLIHARRLLKAIYNRGYRQGKEDLTQYTIKEIPEEELNKLV